MTPQRHLLSAMLEEDRQTLPILRMLSDHNPDVRKDYERRELVKIAFQVAAIVAFVGFMIFLPQIAVIVMG